MPKSPNFIQLIFSIRDVIIHREGLSDTNFCYNGDSGRWVANFVKINRETYEYIKSCKDTKCVDGKLTNWGVYKILNDYMLEPHQFSIVAIGMLVKFVDEYLRLLGCSSFIENIKQQNTDFAHEIKIFEAYRLGF